MSPNDIDTDALRRIANTELARIQSGIASDVTSASGALNKCSRMAGDDEVSVLFGNPYDLAAGGRVNGNGAIEAATLCANAVGALCELLWQSAANIDDADDASVIVGPGESGLTPPSLQLTRIPNLRKAVGSPGLDEPFGWFAFESVGDWPNGFPDKLANAAGAWLPLNAQFVAHQAELTKPISEINTMKMPRVTEIASDMTKVSKAMNDVAVMSTALSTTTLGYGARLGSVQAEITRLCSELGVVSMGGAGKGKLAWVELAVDVLEDAIKHAAKMGQVQTALAGLTMTALDKSKTCASVVAKAEGVQAALKPILSRAPTIVALTDASGKPYNNNQARFLRRPALRESVKKAIMDRTSKETIKGQLFFKSEVHPWIRIPVDKTYHDPNFFKGMRLVGYPGGPQDKFYEDPQTGYWYPVKPEWQWGHDATSEWWRIVEHAQKSNMSQADLNKLVQNPDLYRIEDQYSNGSHRDEQPREGE